MTAHAPQQKPCGRPCWIRSVSGRCNNRAIAIDGFSLSPATRALRGIRPKVLLFVGLLAVVIHDGNSVRCGAGNCDLAGTKQ